MHTILLQALACSFQYKHYVSTSIYGDIYVACNGFMGNTLIIYWFLKILCILKIQNKKFPYLVFIKCNEIWTHGELALWLQNVK